MVRRIYVEKKSAYAAAANELFEDLKGYLKLEGLKKVRILIRYDVENLSDDVFATAQKCVFCEPPVDDLYEDDFYCFDFFHFYFFYFQFDFFCNF